MYVQASRGRAVQPRAGGNAIRARKCVATTDNAFCFDANATISSTASTAVTSVVVVRPLCASVSSHSSNSCHFPNIYFFFHQARKKLNYRYRRDKNKRFYYFNDKNMIELWDFQIWEDARFRVTNLFHLPSFFLLLPPPPHFGAFNRRENKTKQNKTLARIERRLGGNMILVVTLEAPKVTSLYTLFVEASLTLVVELLWLVSRCLLTCRMEMCQWWMHSGNREMRQCYPLCWRIWRIWMR